MAVQKDMGRVLDSGQPPPLMLHALTAGMHTPVPQTSSTRCAAACGSASEVLCGCVLTVCSECLAAHLTQCSVLNYSLLIVRWSFDSVDNMLQTSLQWQV